MKAQVHWDGHNWVAVVDVGGATFAKRLDQLRGRLAEVVELMNGRVIDPADIELEVDFPGAAEAIALTAERVAAEEASRRVTERTRDVVRQLRRCGMSLRDVSTLTGISHQRVHQLVK